MSLEEQRRVLASTASAQQLEWFDRAATALPPYLKSLGLVDVGPLLGAPSSPNVVRHVRLQTDEDAVLKLIGHERSQEAATLEVWNTAGTPAPRVLDHGVSRHAEAVSHLLLEKVAGTPMSHEAMPKATAAAARLFAQGHQEPPAEVRPLAEIQAPRLRRAADTWRQAGYVPPVDPAGVLQELSSDPVLLHGDAVGANVLADGDQLTLIDPAGVHGPYEYDSAQWVARALAVAGPQKLDALGSLALEADPALDGASFQRCLVVELIIEVMYRILRPEQFLDRGAPRATFDRDTRHLVTAVAERLAP